MTMFRTPVFSRRQPGGVYAIVDESMTTGNIFWVHSGTGTNAVANGRTPDGPFATIAYAFSSDVCTASKGDIIFVMPGHTETVAAAAGIVMDIAGVKVIGLGWGNQRPTITFSTDTLADIDIDAASITIKNIRFIGNIASLDAPIDVNAAGFTMEDCDFFCAAATTDIDITVITDANADDMTIRNCNFNLEYSNAATAVAVSNTMTEVIRLVGADRAVIEDCYMAGNFTTSAINGITTASAEVRIVNNHIRNVSTTDVAGIVDLVAGCTGMIAYNQGWYGLHDDGSALALIIDPASCAMIENYFSNVVTEAGGIVGTRST